MIQHLVCVVNGPNCDLGLKGCLHFQLIACDIACDLGLSLVWQVAASCKRLILSEILCSDESPQKSHRSDFEAMLQATKIACCKQLKTSFTLATYRLRPARDQVAGDIAATS